MLRLDGQGVTAPTRVRASSSSHSQLRALRPDWATCLRRGFTLNYETTTDRASCSGSPAPTSDLPPSSMSGELERRTFAIISHPDAGKTTLTESLLQAAGAIHEAGKVRARGESRRARSDWMKIEQQRGISVTSSVMTFQRGRVLFNLLDTPGHEDFSEDTYRTQAVDCAIMVIDAAKGIEAQTRKLFEVCRLRNIPIITFINKVDREGLSPFALLDQIADKLQLDVSPQNWPTGMGGLFHGLYDLLDDTLLVADGSNGLGMGSSVKYSGIGDPPLQRDSAGAAESLRENGELALAAYDQFDLGHFRRGDLTPCLWQRAEDDWHRAVTQRTCRAWAASAGAACQA